MSRARRTTEWLLTDEFDPWPVFAVVEDRFPRLMSDSWQFATGMLVDDRHGTFTAPTVAAAAEKWQTSHHEVTRLILDASPRNPRSSTAPVLRLEFNAKAPPGLSELNAVVRAPNAKAAATAISVIDEVIAEAAAGVANPRTHDVARRPRWYRSADFWHDPWVVGVGSALAATFIGVVFSVVTSH